MEKEFDNTQIIEVVCKDCKIPFKRHPSPAYEKCEHCRDRDQAYKERAYYDENTY